MTDYYEEFDLDRSLGIDELNRELSHAESVWKNRLLSWPEEAHKSLHLIDEARKAFKTETTRRNYDRELAESKKPKPSSSPNASGNADFAHWRSEAERYLSEGQSDLAKVAVEKALAVSGNARDDSEFCLLAARIYTLTGDGNAALSFINTAIVLEPSDPTYECWKTRILIYAEQNRRSYEASYTGRARDSAELAVKKAVSAGDRENEGIAYGLLASIQYHLLGLGDVAEENARKAVNLGDALGNGRSVLADIEAARTRNREAAERERLRRQEEERRAQQKRAEEALRAQQIEARNREREQKRIAYENRRSVLNKMNAIGWIVFFLSVALSVFLMSSSHDTYYMLCIFSGIPLAIGIFMLNLGGGINYSCTAQVIVSLIAIFIFTNPLIPGGGAHATLLPASMLSGSVFIMFLDPVLLIVVMIIGNRVGNSLENSCEKMRV